MTDEAVELYNTDGQVRDLLDALGVQVEIGGERTVFEMRGTKVNKAGGYWLGMALQSLAKMTAGGALNAPASMASGTMNFEWRTRTMSTTFVANSRSEVVRAESSWEVRTEHTAVVTTRVLDGESLLLHSTSTHSNR